MSRVVRVGAAPRGETGGSDLAFYAHARPTRGIAGDEDDAPFFEGFLQFSQRRNGDTKSGFKARNCGVGDISFLAEFTGTQIQRGPTHPYLHRFEH